MEIKIVLSFFGFDFCYLVSTHKESKVKQMKKSNTLLKKEKPKIKLNQGEINQMETKYKAKPKDPIRVY